MKTIVDQCSAAKGTVRQIAALKSDEKNKILVGMADALIASESQIIAANAIDIENGIRDQLNASLIDRMMLNRARIEAMANGLRTIASLRDPVGEVVDGWVQPNGLRFSKVRVPFGVIAIIYEARPNVTADAVGLCLKTGNAVVLRGSSSTYQSNRVIVDVLKSVIPTTLSQDIIQLLDDTSREGVSELVTQKRYLDLVIPRGGASLIQTVVNTATVPSIETGIGNCHVYVDRDANLEWAFDVIMNAKVQRPSVCNACESVLIHVDVVDKFLTRIADALVAKGVEIRGCDRVCDRITAAQPASEFDWGEEFLDLIVSMRVVDSLTEAIDHINHYGTLHSESIISDNLLAVTKFSQEVDAAAVLVNASTRFVDGGEFGFGAEMGISTQKLHARGPMGLPELTTVKYVISGEGNVR